MSDAIAALEAIDADNGDLLCVVETSKGSRNKYSFNAKLSVFELKKTLPRGMSFPYNFGFIPATIGGDGDPLDVLILDDEPAPTGALIRIRAIGAIEAQERESEGEWFRNDRLIGVAKHSAGPARLYDIEPRLLDEIEAFFHDYLAREGKTFQPLRRSGPEGALQLVEAGRRRRESSAFA